MALVKRPLKLILRLIVRVVLSPIVLLLFGYFYFGNWREAYLISLFIYSAFACGALLFMLATIPATMATFNIFGLLKRGYRTFLTLGFLVVYWLGYFLAYGDNFSLNA